MNIRLDIKTKIPFLNLGVYYLRDNYIRVNYIKFYTVKSMLKLNCFEQKPFKDFFTLVYIYKFGLKLIFFMFINK